MLINVVCRQDVGEHAIERPLLRFIGGRCCLIEEQPVRLDQKGASDREALLLAERQHLRPMRFLVQASA